MSSQEQSFSSHSPTGPWSISPSHSLSWPDSANRSWAQPWKSSELPREPGQERAVLAARVCHTHLPPPQPETCSRQQQINTGGEFGLGGAMAKGARAQHRASRAHIHLQAWEREGITTFPGQQGCLSSVILPVALPALPAALSARGNSSREEGGRAQLTQLSNTASLCPRETRHRGLYAAVLFSSSSNPVQAASGGQLFTLYTY